MTGQPVLRGLQGPLDLQAQQERQGPLPDLEHPQQQPALLLYLLPAPILQRYLHSLFRREQQVLRVEQVLRVLQVGLDPQARLDPQVQQVPQVRQDPQARRG